LVAGAGFEPTTFRL